MPSTASNTAIADQADDQHVERAHAAMHQHLVDDDLEEQRRDEREELQEERGDQHLAEQAAVFVDRAEEPGDVEPAGEIRQAMPAAPSARGGRPRSPRIRLASSCAGAGIRGTLHQHLVLVRLAQQQEAAVAQHRDARQGVRGSRSQLGSNRARLEAEPWRSAASRSRRSGACPIGGRVAARRPQYRAAGATGRARKSLILLQTPFHDHPTSGPPAFAIDCTKSALNADCPLLQALFG